MRGLYIHIPFCKQICKYCDFPKMVSKQETIEKYLIRLFEELDSKKEDLAHIDTVYIGGGTPNLLSDSQLSLLFSKIKPYLDSSKESTIECNPELITDKQAQLFYEYKINRVSLGVQTTIPSQLEALGRRHKKEDVTKAIDILRKNHIENISCDFIYGIPNQTKYSLKEDIDYVLDQNLPHISFYSLILEDKTIFMHLMNKKELTLPDEDMVADMEEYINLELKNHGYHHYEVSNYSKIGFESIHNQLYWQCEEYIGIGMGASGYIKPYRYTNYHTLREYMNTFEESREEITLEEQKKEFMMLGLRMLDGIDMEDYQNRFHSDCFKDFDLDKHIKSGMLKIKENKLYIPEDKIFIANQVYMEFV